MVVILRYDHSITYRLNKPSVNPNHVLRGNTAHAQGLANPVAKSYPLWCVHALHESQSVIVILYPTIHSCQKPGCRLKTSHATAAKNLAAASKHHTPRVELNAPKLLCTSAGTILPASLSPKLQPSRARFRPRFLYLRSSGLESCVTGLICNCAQLSCRRLLNIWRAQKADREARLQGEAGNLVEEAAGYNLSNTPDLVLVLLKPCTFKMLRSTALH